MKSHLQPTQSEKSIVIDETLTEKCSGPNQFEKFDNLFRAVIAVPKAAIDKEEKKWKLARAKKKSAKKPD